MLFLIDFFTDLFAALHPALPRTAEILAVNHSPSLKQSRAEGFLDDLSNKHSTLSTETSRPIAADNKDITTQQWLDNLRNEEILAIPPSLQQSRAMGCFDDLSNRHSTLSAETSRPSPTTADNVTGGDTTPTWQDQADQGKIFNRMPVTVDYDTTARWPHNLLVIVNNADFDRIYRWKDGELCVRSQFQTSRMEGSNDPNKKDVAAHGQKIDFSGKTTHPDGTSGSYTGTLTSVKGKGHKVGVTVEGKMKEAQVLIDYQSLFASGTNDVTYAGFQYAEAVKTLTVSLVSTNA